MWLRAPLLPGSATPWSGLALVLFAASCGTPGHAVYHRPCRVGSEATADPLTTNLQYALDDLQVPRSFGTEHFSRHLRDVLHDVANPAHTVHRDGGLREFVNAEILPIDPEHTDDSVAALPNYGLHLFGGGLLFRKNAEWFAAHDFPEPYLFSGALSMAAELAGEATERPTNAISDAVADVWIFRPLGFWLFHDDERAQWIDEHLLPAAWPHLLMADASRGQFVNTGMSYVVRPPLLGAASPVQPFAYFGITNLAGLSADLGDGNALSGGFGATTVEVDPVEIRESAGLFLDHERSLLSSVLWNAGEDLRLRFNAYPGTLLPAWTRGGVFVGWSRDRELSVGLSFGLPVGIAGTFER